MSIKFNKVELKAYPKLKEIQVGMLVVALKGTDYESLVGHITDIKYGSEKETENETILDIYVDFDEPSFTSIEKSHPHLNGTGITDVIMGEDELGFKFSEDYGFFFTAEGKAVCQNCHAPMNVVKELQFEDVVWHFKDGKYVKGEPDEGSNGLRCTLCDGKLNDDEKVFEY